jgi:hypothetical protein
VNAIQAGSSRWAAPLGAALVASLAHPAAAAAAPPNDDRADAAPISVPGLVQGTTVGSSLEPSEPGPACVSAAGSVWYRVSLSRPGGVVVRLHAGGDLDGAVDVFRRRRSRLESLGCDATDDAGDAATSFRADAGGRYLVRVTKQVGSVDAAFTLRLQPGPPAARPPGRRLPRRGGRGRLDRVLRVDAAWSVRLRSGRPYRMNLIHGRYCMPLQLFAPGVGSFDAPPVKELSCGGYGVFTAPPGASGRYVLRVQADRSSRRPQPYRLLVGRARRDDLAPGIALANFARRRGHLNGGGLDGIDLYRFDVARRSALDLDLTGPPDGDFDLELRNDAGRAIACGCGAGADERVVEHLRPGRYYAAVRARDQRAGRYVLTRRSRTITRTLTTIDGSRRATSLPGRSVGIAVLAAPGASGRARLTIEHFDPFEGWQPYRQRRVRVSGGRALVRFRPPSVGRWRARSDFLGSRLFAPSASRFASLIVAGPLRQ